VLQKAFEILVTGWKQFVSRHLLLSIFCRIRASISPVINYYILTCNGLLTD